MSAVAIAALLTGAAWSYVAAGRARLAGWALFHPEEAADLFADLAEGRRRARLHAALVILTWPVTLRHLPTAAAVAHAVAHRTTWGLMGVWVRPSQPEAMES